MRINIILKVWQFGRKGLVEPVLQGKLWLQGLEPLRHCTAHVDIVQYIWTLRNTPTNWATLWKSKFPEITYNFMDFVR